MAEPVTEDEWSLPLGGAIVQIAKVLIGAERRWVLRANCGHVPMTREQWERFVAMAQESLE